MNRDIQNDTSAELGDGNELSLATVDAMTDLSILCRLKFAESLLVGRLGSRESQPRDMIVVTANEVLRSVISVLEKHPRAAKLGGSPEP
jgi:hypothetical protein